MRITSRFVLLVAVCTVWLTPAPATPQGSLADLVAPSRPTDLPGTEQESIVRAVVGRLATLAHLPAVTPQAPTITVTTLAASPAVFSVAVNGGAPLTLKVVGHIWDPRTYLPIAAALGVRPEPAATPSAGAAEANFVEGLTEPSLAHLIAEDTRVSTALRAQPRAAVLHEQAALLLGAMALREGANLYTDGRPAWSRLTAHLTMARAVNGAGTAKSSLPGRLADAVLLVDVGREIDALAALAPLAAAEQSAAVRVWATALRVRATGDWRLVDRPAKSPTIARVAYAKAYAWRVGLGPVLAWMDDANPDVDLPLLRVLLSQPLSVAVGNRFSAAGLMVELNEAEEAARAYGVAITDDPTALLRAIGRPTATGPFRVLDWPLVASTAERHILARLKSLYDAQRLLGQRERLRQMPIELEKTFATLPLVPTALALMGGDGAARHLAAAAAIVRARKDAIPPALWTALVYEGQRSARSVSWPTADVWFNPWQPDGTALTTSDRLARQGAPAPPLPMAEALHRLAPSDTWLSWRLAWWRVPSGRPTIAAVRAELGPAVAYDSGAIYRMFRGLDGTHQEYVVLGTQMCELNVDRCEELAQELLKEGRDAEAADELRRWFNRAQDRVAASNRVLWLTRYLLDQGQAADARAIAVSADDVGSGAGMLTLAEVKERQGDQDGAEAGYKRVQDRYGTAWHLGAYYLRRWKATGDTALRDRGLALVAQSFPSGFEAVPSAGAAPVDGVAFTNFGGRAAKAGLRKTDIIVGVDGVRVRSEAQFDVLMRASHDTAVQFTVWRDGAYATVKGTLPQRWLGTGLRTHRPGAGETQ
ncbi:PDZ domain-containing protein [Luteitalea sp.]|uniref:PDZ domain-containing protein n=1 Tax=Luteitalea sp. TaxID=2004800 RepID=UPI0025BBABFF|nr:PDZ domain-containing protein [Luteitalea sp.]